jgi:hypothetical protein
MEKIDNFLMNLEGGITFVEDGFPVIISSSVSNISLNSATSGGSITDDRGTTVTAKGVCWNTTGSPTTSDDCSNDGGGTGDFESHLSNLLPGTTYYVRSYATNSEGTSYGSETSFTTEAGLPIVTTSSVSNISTTSVTISGNVIDDQGAAVTARGVCWNTTGSPTTDDDCTNDGSGMGDFESSLSDLTPRTTYYVRAYAINSEGTSFGNETVFTTDLVLPETGQNMIPVLLISFIGVAVVISKKKYF